MKNMYTFLSPVVVKSHLIDVNLGLDCLIQITGSVSSCDEKDLEVIQQVLIDIQSHVHAIFHDVELLERRVNTAVSSLHSVN